MTHNPGPGADGDDNPVDTPGNMNSKTATNTNDQENRESDICPQPRESARLECDDNPDVQLDSFVNQKW